MLDFRGSLLYFYFFTPLQVLLRIVHPELLDPGDAPGRKYAVGSVLAQLWIKLLIQRRSHDLDDAHELQLQTTTRMSTGFYMTQLAVFLLC